MRVHGALAPARVRNLRSSQSDEAVLCERYLLAEQPDICRSACDWRLLSLGSRLGTVVAQQPRHDACDSGSNAVVSF